MRILITQLLSATGNQQIMRYKFIYSVLFIKWTLLGGFCLYFWSYAIFAGLHLNYLVTLGFVAYQGVLLLLFYSFIQEGEETSKKEVVEYIDVSKDELFRLQKHESEKIVKDFLQSTDFKKGVLEHIPSGKLNEEGTNYVRFIISSLEDKKKEFRSTTRFFLITTTVLTLLFSGVVIYFGFVLLESDAVGFNHSLKELRQDYKELSTQLGSDVSNRARILMTVIDGKTDELNTELSKDSKLVAFEGLPSITELGTTIDDLILRASFVKDSIYKLNSSLPNAKQDKSSKIKLIEQYVAQLSSEKKLFLEKEMNIKNLNEDIISNIQSINPKIDLINDENYFNEFLKRLAIGLIVVSFFLAIIRFCVNQYKTNFKESIQAESDSLLVRKTYLALQNTKEPEIQKIVYQAFLNQMNSDTKPKENRNNDVNNLMKSILSIIEKNK
ncbi:MAG: hypothetical protein ABJF04_11870 [Reichenbachiella sp.]|uniref:hypothetical protein n=1 Tax=Reichenbachiella sp. TaxID=2184521 RepID=UPI003266550F